MSLTFRSDDEIIQEIREKYNHHKVWAEKYFRILEAAESVSLTESMNAPAHLNGQPLSADDNGKRVRVKRKQTFEDVIIQIFKNGDKPLTTRMLIDEYVRFTGKEIERKNMSSRLAMMAKRTGEIKHAKYEEAFHDTKHWWGLKEWFFGDELQPKFSHHVKINKKKGTSRSLTSA